MGRVGVSDWESRPAESVAGERQSLTDSLIIDVFFGVAFFFHTVQSGWGNAALADQMRRSASLARRYGPQSETTGRQVKAAKVASLSSSLRGWNLRHFHAGSFTQIYDEFAWNTGKALFRKHSGTRLALVTSRWATHPVRLCFNSCQKIKSSLYFEWHS